MKLATTAQMREMDRRTMEEFQTPGDVLMDRAGMGVADTVRGLASSCGYSHPFVLLIAGRGNNGGDAFAAAWHLRDQGYDCEVWLVGAANEIQGDAQKHLSRAKSAKISIREMPVREEWEHAARFFSGADMIVDGILGTGSNGPPRGPASAAIQFINAQSKDAFVVAIDIPSGLNADTGTAEGEAVFADITATIGLPKVGLMEPSALNYVGSIEVIDIGIPAEVESQTISEVPREMIYLTDIRPMFKRRPRASHKGDYGRVLLIGGARGYTGAIAFAARAAVRSGAGLVHVLTPAGILPIVAGACLEAMVLPGEETEDGSLSQDCWPSLKEQMDLFDAILIGPGLSRHAHSLALVRHLIRQCKVPMVLDADAISVLEGQPHWIEKASCPVVITPHPGELSKLMQHPVDVIQLDRCAAAVNAAKKTHSTVILKGAGTVVAQDGKPVCINSNGNPGMATGGMGDVLAGMLAGFLAQHLPAFDAARAAVYVHGRAGDIAAWRKSQAGLSAGDVIEEIPFALRDVTVR